MAISPRPASWTAGETLPTELEPPSLRESVSSGQFVSDGLEGAPARESLSTVLAEMIAKSKGVDPTDEAFRLYEHLEPEALDSLYAHARRQEDVDWHLEFDVGDESVHVGSDGSIEVVRTY